MPAPAISTATFAPLPQGRKPHYLKVKLTLDSRDFEERCREFDAHPEETLLKISDDMHRLLVDRCRENNIPRERLEFDLALGDRWECSVRGRVAAGNLLFTNWIEDNLRFDYLTCTKWRKDELR